MKKSILSLLFMLSTLISMCAEQNVSTVDRLLERIGGEGTSSRFITILDTDIDDETFIIEPSHNGKPCIKGSTISAITTGINWYLNHYAHINLSWNNLTCDLTHIPLPLPKKKETHTCDAHYRYYLNYCTFSYSMSTWTWQRWQQEIDWMALHGINMPLQIIGLDAVWYNMLTKDYNYTHDEANAFIAGPAFQAWWGMNNLEGWGGPNPSWWYKRQTELARKILQRERELGIEPVLPGFSGMVPSNFTGKTYICSESQGGWCGFNRPFILDPTTDDFRRVAQHYYSRLTEVMGTSAYYSMDPFHEGGSISSGKYAEGYRAIFDAMDTNCGHDSRWVIQQWQWSQNQSLSLSAVPAGRLIVLDLFSDGQPAFDRFNGYEPQHAIYCAIPNFGGRTGFFGRIPKMADNYFAFKSRYKSIKGIGAAPEAIEQTPVVYDLLFELPWMGTKPDTKEWIRNYSIARYGTEDPNAIAAWTLLHSTILNNTTNLQGPHEAVICSRPSLEVHSVSTWGGCELYYDKNVLIKVISHLLKVKQQHTPIFKANYEYDLVDLTRQALTDHSTHLLSEVRKYSTDPSSEEFIQAKERFLQLILDIDALLATNSSFRLGTWTERARAIADEAEGTTEADKDWLELDNARTLITTWGHRYAADAGGLRDYSYREWQGMLRDYYYPRWQYWFTHHMQSPDSWYDIEHEWAHNSVLYYQSRKKGNVTKCVHRLMKKYFKLYG